MRRIPQQTRAGAIGPRLTLLAATLPALLLSVPALARYLCRNCGRSFSGIPGFKGRHTDPKTIVRVLREVVRGLSCASAQGMLADEGTAVHESTIYRDMIRN